MLTSPRNSSFLFWKPPSETIDCPEGLQDRFLAPVGVVIVRDGLVDMGSRIVLGSTQALALSIVAVSFPTALPAEALAARTLALEAEGPGASPSGEARHAGRPAPGRRPRR